MLFDLGGVHQQFKQWRFRNNIKARKRLWLKISTKINNKVSLVDVMTEFRDRRLRYRKSSIFSVWMASQFNIKNNDPIVAALDEWIAIYSNGERFEEAVKGWVSNDEQMLFSSAKLSDAFVKIIALMDSKAKIRKSIISGVLYPSILFSIALAMIYFLSTELIPSFTKISKGRIEWTGDALQLVNLSAFVQDWFVLIVAVILGAVLAFFRSLPRWNGPLRIKVDRHAPYSVYRTFQGSTWLISLGALVESGVRLQTALEMLAGEASPWLRIRILRALQGVNSGLNLGDALEPTVYDDTRYDFPDREIIDDLATYSKHSGFSEALQMVADEWIKESVERIDIGMKLVMTLGILLIAFILGFTITGFFDLQQQLSDGLRAIH